MDEQTKLKRKQYEKEWREKNREHLREYKKAYVAKQPEKERERHRQKSRAYRATPDGRSNRLYHGAKKRAKNLNMEFTITEEWVAEKVKSGFCEVTGLPFKLVEGWNQFAPSLDKTDPTKGYTPDNVKVVVWCYNTAKGVGTHEDVLVLARALVANNDNQPK